VYIRTDYKPKGQEINGDYKITFHSLESQMKSLENSIICLGGKLRALAQNKLWDSEKMVL